MSSINLSAHPFPQAIIFDFGGVMTGKRNTHIIEKFICKTLNLSREVFLALDKERRNVFEIDPSQTYQQFWISYAEQNQIILSEMWEESFIEVMKKSFSINPGMYTLVEELKEQQIRIGLLSNIPERVAKLFRDFCWYDPFKAVCLLSCDIKIKKPDPDVYRLLLKTLNLKPQEIVFIDDQQDNIDSAKELGIDAILFHSEEQLRIELSMRGIIQLHLENAR